MTFDGTGLRPNWLIAIRRYLIAIAIGNLVWETAQLPLYTIWQTGTPAAIAGAVLHCTLGDIVIALIALVAALALVGSPAWPDAKFASVMVAVAIGAAGYTIYSEYVNTVLRSSWAYSEWMPTLPFVGTGLAPLAQALTVPACALLVTGGRMSPAPLERHQREEKRVDSATAAKARDFGAK